MALTIPVGNNSSNVFRADRQHLLMHLIMAMDLAAPQQSVTIDSTGRLNLRQVF